MQFDNSIFCYKQQELLWGYENESEKTVNTNYYYCFILIVVLIIISNSSINSYLTIASGLSSVRSRDWI